MNPDIKKTFAVLNQMVADGIIENYAVGGAIAAIFYVEAFSTEDLDVFVPAPQDQFIIELPGLDYLKARGYTTFEKEGIVVEGWPVQFLPATTDLEREAYINAQLLDFDAWCKSGLTRTSGCYNVKRRTPKGHRSYKNVSIAGSGEVGSPRGGHHATRSFSKMGRLRKELLT